jgi:predicted 3-demethylubiquinone-9 3-methyltransferase (glyoxalase superfamily)
VRCQDQDEVDRLWSQLTADGGEEGPCGWLKDRFGLSWQIVPNRLTELLADPDPARANAAMQAMLQMHKIEIKALEDAANTA